MIAKKLIAATMATLKGVRKVAQKVSASKPVTAIRNLIKRNPAVQKTLIGISIVVPGIAAYLAIPLAIKLMFDLVPFLASLALIVALSIIIEAALEKYQGYMAYYLGGLMNRIGVHGSQAIEAASVIIVLAPFIIASVLVFSYYHIIVGVMV